MYNKKTHIHFIGIGGIGMSGIATILAHQGYTISGCDTSLEQKSITNLRTIGCVILQGHTCITHKNIIPDVVVYTSAVNENHPELVAARAKKIPTIPRSIMLAELMRTKYSIAIAGSHGKTTTTSILSHILIEAGIDPTVIIGGHLKNISSNARLGMSDFLVAEADESDRSLLHLYATIGVITNIDLEHLETYTDLDDVKNTFKQFLSNLPFYGKALLCIDDKNVQDLLPLPHRSVITYGINPEADYQPHHIALEASFSQFDLYDNSTHTNLGSITFHMPGIHNILNATAASAVARELGVDFATISKALGSFKGIDRRFSYHGTYKEAEIFDDYAHHPKELHHTLTVARKRAKNKLIVVFQPHRFSRTMHLWNDFIDVFTKHSVDNLFITDIYPASEQPIPGITSQNLISSIAQTNSAYIPFDFAFTKLIQAIKQHIEPGDLILFVGAGKLHQCAAKLADQ